MKIVWQMNTMKKYYYNGPDFQSLMYSGVAICRWGFTRLKSLITL